jgi:DNA-binding transcriptional MocR family regulator
MEPAAGAGGMVIAAALLDGGTHYQPIMHATLLDTDATASHMAYWHCVRFATVTPCISQPLGSTAMHWRQTQSRAIG